MQSIYGKFIKRIAELLLCIPVILIFLIPFVIICLVLLIYNKGNVFFLQIRTGKHTRLFTIVKFRTLRGENYSLESAPDYDLKRLTPLGSFLRRTHLDELPQLWNILIGDMAVIGPRPLLPEYIPVYTTYQLERHLVRPGVLGLSQLKGGNMLSWDHRLRYDSFYAQHLSFTMDFYILWLGIKSIIGFPETKKERPLFSESFVTYAERKKSNT